MKQRPIGNTGLEVSEVGLGCNSFGQIAADTSRVIVHKALDLGVTLFDTAPIYGVGGYESEMHLGAALGARRKDVVINTKFGVRTPPGGGFVIDSSRESIIEGVEGSLKRLNTDYIDIYMLHHPDGTIPQEETLRALEDIVAAGKVRHIGCSNLPAWRLVEAQWVSRTAGLGRYIVSQNEYSLAARAAEADLLPVMKAYDIAFMPYAPLANGLLTGKYSRNAPPPPGSRLARNAYGFGDRFLTDSMLALAERLGAFANAQGHSLIELAYGWLLSNPRVCSVIAGATSPAQVEANVAAGDSWQLSEEALAEVDALCLQI